MRRLRWGVFAAAGLVLGVVAYRVQTHALHSASHSLATVAVGWSYLIAGLIAWRQRPANRLGPLLVVTAFALLARQLRYSDDAVVFTIFFALGDIGYALVGHSALAYPFGRVTDRWERALVVAGYAVVLVLPPLTLLFHEPTSPLIGFDPIPRESLVLVHGDAAVQEFLQKTQIVLFFGVLSALFIVLVFRRLWHATPRMRRVHAPLLLAAVAVALRAIFECVFTFVDRPFAYDYLFWWQVAAFVALPLALVAGIVRTHLARSAVGDLVVELEHTPPEGLHDALTRTLGDPSLEVAFWLPESGTFADAEGSPVELPSDGDRAVTQLEHDGQPLAALVHDRSLLDEPELVRGALAAARLSLENARLQADMRAQLVQVQESRVRIVAAADEERRRIERDLHDGAQQRLVALALQLRTAQRQLEKDPDPAVEALLASAVEELQAAVTELRELARGVHPAILSEDGLAAALESLATRSPIRIELDTTPERFSPQVEATAYFVACEALANVTKHADASSAAVTLSRRDGTLRVEVSDDGIGGARPTTGSGLTGLADRVEALGGRLRLESPPGGGTRVVAEIPCAS